MTSPPPSDVSLYELAANATPPPTPLQLSPTMFKSIVALLLDLLVEENLPATIWLKLPRGEAWQAEIDRFCQLISAPYTIYSLQTYPKATSPEAALRQVASASSAQPSRKLTLTASPLPDHEGGETQATGAETFNFDDFILDELADLPSTIADNTRVRELPLSPDSQLKREYFLLVTSPAFYGLVLAHRPRVGRLSQEARLGAAEEAERKHPLLCVCSFNQAVIQRVLEEGINSAICFGQPDASSASLQELLLSWDDLKQQQLVSSLNSEVLSKLLIKQIQRQEDLWRTTATQRRQAEALPELQRENEELLNALRTKDEFIKTMGLELRTPLSTMKTALSLLNSPNIKPPQRQRYMDMLSRECDRQSSLISGVMDLVQLESSGDETPMEALRLSDIVPGVVSTYQPLAQEKGVMLGYVVPEELPPAACYTPWLKQIVINLLHNSIKFTPQGGQVWVRAKQQGEMIQLEFRDTGVGIASSDLPRIFERFYRVRGSEDANGVGLGLSIVQQLLLRCGGSISVKSKQGEGSAFSVLLPIYQGG